MAEIFGSVNFELLVEGGRKFQGFHEVKKWLSQRLMIWKWLLQLWNLEMSAVFFLLSFIPRGQFPELVFVVAKQDYSIYSESTKKSLKVKIRLFSFEASTWVLDGFHCSWASGEAGLRRTKAYPWTANTVSWSLQVSTQRKTGVEGWDFMFHLDLALVAQLPEDCIHFRALRLPWMMGSRRLLRVSQWTNKGKQTPTKVAEV